MIFANSKTDSYPDGLGQVLLNELRNSNADEWKTMMKNAIMISSEDDFDRCAPKCKSDLISHFEKEFAILYPHTNKEEAMDTFDYHHYLTFYGYSYSMLKILKSGVLFTIYQNNVDNYQEDIYDKVIYTYDCSYSYIIDLDEKRFIFNDINNYSKHIYSFSNLPRSLPTFL